MSSPPCEQCLAELQIIGANGGTKVTPISRGAPILGELQITHDLFEARIGLAGHAMPADNWGVEIDQVVTQSGERDVLLPLMAMYATSLSQLLRSADALSGLPMPTHAWQRARSGESTWPTMYSVPER